jgi:isochorismate pyruvate lyase
VSTEPDPLGPPLRRFSDPLYQPQADNLAALRVGIDNLDKRIVALIAQRALLVKDAARFKANVAQVAAVARQQQVFDKVRALAQAQQSPFEGLEDVVVATYQAMVAAFVAQEARYFNQMMMETNDENKL